MKWVFQKDHIGRLQEDSEFPFGPFSASPKISSAKKARVVTL